MFGAVVLNDHHDAVAAAVVADAHDARMPGQHRVPLGCAGLEQLHHARQPASDVLRAGDAAGVEGAHRQLRAGLADRLSSDHADRFALLDQLASGQRHAVGRSGDARHGAVAQR